jgi:hypothetical protein
MAGLRWRCAMSAIMWVLWTHLTLLTMTSPGGVKVPILDPQALPHQYDSEDACLEAVAQEAVAAPVVTRTMGTTRLVVVSYAWCVQTPQLVPRKD